MWRALVIYFATCVCYSANYYVSTNGNNSDPGSLAQPWRNVWKAALVASAGDAVNIGPGEFNEYVTNTASGSSGSPIVFTGTRGSNGEWLTIVDPSTVLTGGWVSATEIGSGVYKYTNLTFESQELSINHKDVGYLYTLGKLDLYTGVFGNGSEISNGVQILTLPSNYIYTNGQTHVASQFWDGIEALYASTNASATYLRLRDGSDPNSLTIRSAGNWDDHVTSGGIVKPAFLIDNKSYLSFSNLLVRGSWACFELKGAAHHITISSNYLANGYARIGVQGGAHDNSITHNEITMDYYGYPTPGAWGTSSTNHGDTLYVLGKILMGNGSAQDNCIIMDFPGNSNTVSGNHLFNGIGNGIVLQSSSTATNTIICSNRLENFASEGIFLSYGEIGTTVFGNSLANSESNMRFHGMDRNGELSRTVYVYRNTFWNPPNTGDNIFMFWYGSPTVVTCWPNYWVYHNSFDGGRSAIYPNEQGPDQGGMPNCFFINNVFCDPFYVYGGIQWWTNSALVGALDYNETTAPQQTYPSASNPAWFGAHNVGFAAAEWSFAVEPNFVLSPGSPSMNSALDVTQSFSLNGTNYSALPSTTIVKTGTGWDIGALEGASLRAITVKAAHIMGK